MTSYTEHDPSTFTYSDVKKNNRGSPTMYVKTAGGQNVTAFTPRLKAPFGASSFDDTKASNNMELNITDPAFGKWLQALDAGMLKSAQRGKASCFRKGKDMSDEMVKAQQHCLYKESSNGTYPATVRLKVYDSTEIQLTNDEG